MTERERHTDRHEKRVGLSGNWRSTYHWIAARYVRERVCVYVTVCMCVSERCNIIQENSWVQ